jgi:DNA-binding CsgD family transcriptional regulator
MTEEIRNMGSDGGSTDVGRLTAAQKECLRLVMAGFKTKEIAYRLGIGVDAVNKRLAGAKTTLGSPSRFHAARVLASHEAAAGYHSSVGDFSAVAIGGAAVNSCLDEADHRQSTARDRDHDRAQEGNDPDTGLPVYSSATGASGWTHLGKRCAWAFATTALLGAMLRVVTHY